MRLFRCTPNLGWVGLGWDVLCKEVSDVLWKEVSDVVWKEVCAGTSAPLHACANATWYGLYIKCCLLVDECRQWAGCVVGQAAFCSGMIGGHVLSWLPILPRHVQEIPASVQLSVLHYWWRGRPALRSAIEKTRQPILHKLCPVQVHERCVPLQAQLVNHDQDKDSQQNLQHSAFTQLCHAKTGSAP